MFPNNSDPYWSQKVKESQSLDAAGLVPAVWTVNRLLATKKLDSHSTLMRRLRRLPPEKALAMRVRPRWIFAESLLLGLFLIPSMREAIVAPIAADYSHSDSQEGHGKLNTFMGRLLDAGHSIDDIASFTSIVRATPGLPHIQTGISAALVGLCCFPLNPLISSGFGLLVGAAHYLLRIGRPLDQGLSTQDWRKNEPSTVAELEALYDKRLEEEKERWVARENFRKSSIEGATDGKTSTIEHSKKSAAQVSSKEGRYDESLLLKRLNLERELRKTNWEMVHCREDLIAIQKALATQI